MSSETNNKYVTIKLDKEYYGISIDAVLSIEKPGQATRVPNAPNHIIGLINLRGEVVPIIDLRTRLAMETKDYDKNSRIVVVTLNEIVAGLVVDASSEVLEIEDESIDKPPTSVGNQSMEYVNGIGKVGDRLVILLDLEKVLEY